MHPLPSTSLGSHSFVAENKGFEKSNAGIENIGITENKKGFRGSCFIKPARNIARYIADGIRTVFHNIRSFLITVCSPPGSCSRKEKGAASRQDSPSSVERDAGCILHDISSRKAEFHEQPAFQGIDDLRALPGHVKLVSNRRGTEGSIKRQLPEEKLSSHAGPALSVASSPSGISGSDSPVSVRKDTGRTLQIDAALDKTTAQPSSARPVSQNAHKARRASMVTHVMMSELRHLSRYEGVNNSV